MFLSTDLTEKNWESEEMSSDVEHFWNDYLPIRPQDATKKIYVYPTE